MSARPLAAAPLGSPESTFVVIAAIHEPGRLDRAPLASLFRAHDSKLLPAGEGVPWPA